jgi:hypothetical protein
MIFKAFRFARGDILHSPSQLLNHHPHIRLAEHFLMPSGNVARLHILNQPQPAFHRIARYSFAPILSSEMQNCA